MSMRLVHAGKTLTNFNESPHLSGSPIKQKKEKVMDRQSERGQTWTRQDKERFLDAVGGYELEAGELGPEEIRSLLDAEADHERP